MNKIFNIRLITPKDVSDFANAASNCPRDVTILASHGEYAVDAKSIMGVYSLNLSEPIRIEIRWGSENIDTYITAFDRWVCD